MKAVLWVFGIAASVEMTGRWWDRPDWWQPARVVALLALAWLVRLHQDHLRRAVWVPLYGAIAAAELLIKLRWQDQPYGVGWYSTTVEIVAGPTASSIGRALRQDLGHAAPVLAVLAGLALAVVGLPEVRATRTRDAVILAAGGVALAWWLISNEWSWFYGFGSATARALPQFLVALAALALGWVGWRRGQAGRLAAAGVALMVLPGLVTIGPASLTGFWPTDAFTGGADLADGFIGGGADISVAMAVAPSSEGDADVVVPLLYLAGLALVATACVRPALPEIDTHPG
jgi:hypothetical protein